MVAAVQPPERLADASLAILGLGLMGGSLALALRGQCRQLLGCDPDMDTLSLAHEMKLVDRLSADPAELLSEVDIVVLAAPVRVILRLLADFPVLHPGTAIVLDIGSTKREIVSAMASLPQRFDPLGGHPMCGKEHASLREAEARLYDNAPFALIPLERTSMRARSLAEQLVQAVGALPLWLDAETHDRWTAATSHLPYLCSAALAAVTPAEAAPLVGPGWRSTTRLAAQPRRMMLDILTTNRDNVLAGLRRLHAQLDTFEQLLLDHDETLLGEELKRAAERRALLLDGSAK
jgi:prephenate dehydrogenase